MLKKRHVLLKFSLGVIVLIILLWVSASYHIGRLISLNECATIAKALVVPQQKAILEHQGRDYHVKLPDRSALLRSKNGSKVYLVLTSFSMSSTFKLLDNYYFKELPDKTWKFQDQVGSGYIFTDGKVDLISTRRTLIRGVEQVSFTIRDIPKR